MVRYDKLKAEREIIEFCRYPVPRTASDIVRMLKLKDPLFYQKTPASLAVKFLRKEVLKGLLSRNILVRYSLEDECWPKARKLLSYYYSKQDQASPRKITEMYQINFIYLGDDAMVMRLPSFKDINLDASALLYNLTKKKRFDNFFLNLLNLIHCYSIPSMKERIRIEMYRLSFEEKERDVLERILEVASKADIMQQFYNNFPFQPDLNKALIFLTLL